MLNKHEYNLKQLENLDNLTLAEKEELVNEIIEHDFNDCDDFEYHLGFEDLSLLKSFINTRYDDPFAYADYASLYGYWDKDKKDIDTFGICDLRDFALRVMYQEIDFEVLANGVDDSAEYLLKKFYNCKSGNNYDYTFLWEAVNKDILINQIVKNVNEYDFINNQLIKVIG